ncbi:hypothetical protein CDL12_14568 [Handroanthus impetiginosus]|uniref:Uncharacterized protein n=1 Tax=Handroanthus impetiginosus TaxID=429701 RepID=A0A2G9H5R1_9LAMI|nr:hypothetical protein CDL12_14568 [Handroanthus impetiginosus]
MGSVPRGSKQDLHRIGIEGFELIETYTKKPQAHQYHPQQAHQYHPQKAPQYRPQKAPLHQVKPNENAVQSCGVVKYCSGVTVMDYSKGNSSPMFRL